ncbi:mannitol-1-phosphate 5-dehydrogenase [Virgibacillus flavescens]|uniref:mannitol-1-phosphate 5-dehydrogenase n=1 Tax=Virgibacillus flavescens TaxID=1611422 RepID=UPI003D32FF19
MLAVHFGAGNIGRGFIGQLLHQSNYHTTFVDVNDAVIKEINEKQQYNVVLASENSESLTVKDVSGINSMHNPDKVIDAIVRADIVTTAVGPNILAVIAELIAKGLRARTKDNRKALTIIACENMIGGSTLLKERVYDHLTEAECTSFEELYSFPDAAVDRIVPNQVNDDPLEVSVEPYYEWVVEESSIKGEKPAIEGITYVTDLKPYIERKLFTVNTGHAVAAYVGYYMGYHTIDEAMKDNNVLEIINGALAESGEALIQTYQFDRQEHQTYINKIIQRFKNPYISDEVTRVGRGPIRKLGPQDRLIRPASLYMEVTGKPPLYLAKTIASVLSYVNEKDDEAVKLQQMIRDEGSKSALHSVTGLPEDHPLIATILDEMSQIEPLKK